MQLSSLLCDSTSEPVGFLVTLLLALGANAKVLVLWFQCCCIQIDQNFVSDTLEHILGATAFKKNKTKLVSK